MKNSLRTYFRDVWIAIGFLYVLILGIGIVEVSTLRNNTKKALKKQQRAFENSKQEFEEHRHTGMYGGIKK